MNNSTISIQEREALLHLFDQEREDAAADERCVALSTQKNQIRSVKDKLGTHTQIGLYKLFIEKVYGVKFDIDDARTKLASISLMIILCISICIPTIRRGRRYCSWHNRRHEVEYLITGI